jgi:hypothetical protein
MFRIKPASLLSKRGVKYRANVSAKAESNCDNHSKKKVEVISISKESNTLELDMVWEDTVNVTSELNATLLMEENWDEPPKNDLKYNLQQWVTNFHVKANAVNELLHILSSYFPELSKDSRSLMKTPRSMEVININPGKYSHIGLCIGVNYVLNQFEEIPPEITIDIGIDGVKLDKKADSPGF